jgi:hypothetical protein
MEPNMIQLEGLNTKQKVLCDVIWHLDTRDRVDAFIRTLPKKDRMDAEVLVEMMILAYIDEVSDTEQAQKLLKGIFK